MWGLTDRKVLPEDFSFSILKSAAAYLGSILSNVSYQGIYDVRGNGLVYGDYIGLTVKYSRLYKRSLSLDDVIRNGVLSKTL